MGFAAKVVNSALKDQAESSPQSGDMFIATRSALMKSASSEMLSISLDAEEEKAGPVSINITCLRHVGLRREALRLLQQSRVESSIASSQPYDVVSLLRLVSGTYAFAIFRRR